MTSFPTVPVTVYPANPLNPLWSVAFLCPYCGTTHHHGGGDVAREPLLGHRVSHCHLDPPDFEHGYVLVEAVRVPMVCDYGHTLAGNVTFDQQGQWRCARCHGRGAEPPARYYQVGHPLIYDPDPAFQASRMQAFDRTVIKPDGEEGCWFRQSGNRHDSGRFKLADRFHSGHIVALISVGVAVPPGYYAVPTCGHRGCVNPRHREIVPNLEAERRLGEHLRRSRHRGDRA